MVSKLILFVLPFIDKSPVIFILYLLLEILWIISELVIEKDAVGNSFTLKKSALF